MPIYAYKCASCGFAKDVLQKLSDAPLSVCPSCGEPAFHKQVTAASFQLKGTGWYVTDFRNEGTGSPSAGESAAGADGGAAAPAAPSTAAAASPSPAPAPASAAPAAPPAHSGGSTGH
ncbi:MAG TPA: zinc ribbon domain-containing protein [Ottowia sp.]|uniref:FmdB family zinc ribbon protein n=1 Tax=Ottowia sp. TaxID=1898956 RepID=UPI002CE8B52B|nr:FmdB family zinc ribbon protein [Ottowia sp.]HMN20286.1 zinc ribbon domain-containing protein [Ottowia sp.]